MSELPPSRPKKIAFLIFPQVEELDFLGPWEMTGIWNTYADGPEHFCVAQGTQPVECAHGLSINPTYGFDNCPEFDVLVVPGGVGRVEQLRNQAFMTFLRERGARCTHLLSICTGALFLAEAGFLNNKTATTHWKFLEALRKYPTVNVREGVRYTRDGNVWTAAGVAAGIDLTLQFIQSFGPDDQADAVGAAGTVQVLAEYLPDGSRYAPSMDLSAAPAFIRDAFPQRS